MATNFPTSVDVLTNPVSNDSLNSPSHSAQHANANDAIEAIEGYLLNRVNGSGTYTGNAVLVSMATYITINITATGRPMLIMASIKYTNANSGANRDVSFQVQNDGVNVLAPGTFTSPQLTSGSVFMAAASTIITPTAGARSITLQVGCTSASSCTLPYASLVILEL